MVEQPHNETFKTRVVIYLAAPCRFGCSTTDNWAIHPIYEHVEETNTITEILADTYQR